jgi:hypothetical protein
MSPPAQATASVEAGVIDDGFLPGLSTIIGDAFAENTAAAAMTNEEDDDLAELPTARQFRASTTQQVRSSQRTRSSQDNMTSLFGPANTSDITPFDHSTQRHQFRSSTTQQARSSQLQRSSQRERSSNVVDTDYENDITTLIDLEDLGVLQRSSEDEW